MRRPFAIYGALFLSGLAALVHELMWVRILGRMFGHTIFAVQTVLTVFFLGIALGAWAISRMRIERPFAAFAAIEVAIGGWGAALPMLVVPLTSWYDAFAPAETETLAGIGARLAVTAIALLVPATLMGATFPLIASALGRVGAVYAINTLGGAAGVWATAFFVLPTIGVSATIWTAAAMNVVAAAIAIRFAPRAVAVVNAEVRPSNEEPLRLAPLLLFLTGLSALALQLLWTRALEQILSGTIYTFAVVLGVFLAGIGLGSLILERLARTRALLGRVLALLAASILLTPLAVLTLRQLHETADLMRGPLLESAIAAALLLIPTTLMGMTFPLLVELGRGSIGRLTAANTLGSVAGPFIAGFVLLPRIGLRNAIIVFALLTACVAVSVARRRVPAIAMLLALAALAPLVTRPVVVAERDEAIVAYRDDTAATVAVVRRGDEQRLKVNNSYSLGGGRGIFTERRQGHVAMFLHPDPRRVLVLGIGTGNTLGAVALHRPERLVAVDLLPGVVDLAARHFAPTNHGVLRDPRVEVLVADATRIVRSSPETFDVVIGDLFHPWQAGVGSLYSLDHFGHVRKRIGEDGVFVQWLPLYQLSTADVRTIARTFHATFPHAQMWLGNFGAATPIAALVGSNAPIAWDEARWRAATADARLAPHLREVYLDNAVELYASFVCDRPLLEEFAGAGPLNTASNPLIEFTAARTFYAAAIEREKRATLEALVKLAAAQDRADRARGAHDTSWFENRIGIRAFIVSFLALEEGKWETAAEAATIAAARCTAYDLPRRTLSAIGTEIAGADPRIAARLFRSALEWNPDDERARDGLTRAVRNF